MTEEQNFLKKQSEDLAEQLKRVPINDWGTQIAVSLQTVHEAGYRAGFQSGKGAAEPVQLPDNDTGLEETGLAELAGEDKALQRTNVTEAEAEEDLGHEFIREIARQIGRFAIRQDVTPGAVSVEFMAKRRPDELGVSADLNIHLRNTDMKG